MGLEEFKSEFYKIIGNGANLYYEMITDIYFLGRFITLKQNMVMISFIAFLFGIIGMFVIQFME